MQKYSQNDIKEVSMMKKQDNLATEILCSAMKKQRILVVAFVLSLIANVVLLVMGFIRN